MTKVSSTKYKVKLTLKSGGKTGKVTFKVAGYDTNGRAQGSNRVVTIH
jgi:hypothetical protein